MGYLNYAACLSVIPGVRNRALSWWKCVNIAPDICLWSDTHLWGDRNQRQSVIVESSQVSVGLKRFAIVSVEHVGKCLWGRQLNGWRVDESWLGRQWNQPHLSSLHPRCCRFITVSLIHLVRKFDDSQVFKIPAKLHLLIQFCHPMNLCGEEKGSTAAPQNRTRRGTNSEGMTEWALNCLAGLICKALKILCGFCFTLSKWTRRRMRMRMSTTTYTATEFRCDVPNKLFSNSKHLLSTNGTSNTGSWISGFHTTTIRQLLVNWFL